MLAAIIFNTVLAKHLPKIENAVLVLHISLFIVVLVCLTVLAPQKSTSSDVWALFLNSGGYESKGLSFFVGLLSPLFAFTGADGAVHMCEEIKNSTRVLPSAMLGKSFDPHILALVT